MRKFWLPVALVLLLSAGCSPRREPATQAIPPAEVAQPDEDAQSGRRFDDFHLPLVINIVPPEVPPEIQGPSPPIREEPKSP